MHQATTTFTRVYGAVQFGVDPKDKSLVSYRRGPSCTLFGFDDANGSHYNVRVPGFPAIESGMTVTALLEDPNDWSMIAGWVNHATGEIACPDIPSAYLLPAVFALSSIFSALLYFTGNEPSALFSLFCLVGAVVSFWYCRKLVGIKHQLLDIARQINTKEPAAPLHTPARTDKPGGPE